MARTNPPEHADSIVSDYYVDYKEVGEEGIERAFSALLDVLRDQLVGAHVDAITCGSHVSERVRPALTDLKALALDQHRERRRRPILNRLLSPSGDPSMAVRLDLAVEEQREILRTFGPYSIHADDDDSVITIHDCGQSLVFAGVAAQVEALAGLPPGSVRELRPDS